MPPVTARRCCAVILSSCALSLTACASNPQMPPADLPTLPPAAVLEYATALGVVFEDCRAAYGDMAAKAAGHAADVQTLGAAWPVIPNLQAVD